MTVPIDVKEVVKVPSRDGAKIPDLSEVAGEGVTVPSHESAVSAAPAEDANHLMVLDGFEFENAEFVNASEEPQVDGAIVEDGLAPARDEFSDTMSQQSKSHMRHTVSSRTTIESSKYPHLFVSN